MKLSEQLSNKDDDSKKESVEVDSFDLSPIHKHMCALAAAGLGTNDIAAVTNYSASRVSIIINHPDAKNYISQLATNLAAKITEDVSLQIQSAAGEAFNKNLHLMRHATSERVQQLSAFDILDRAGFKPKEVHVSATLQLPQEEANLISTALREISQPIVSRKAVENAVEVLKSEPLKNAS